MRTHRPRLVAAALALVTGLTITGCGKKSATGTATTTTVAAPGRTTPITVAPGGSTSEQALDQQIQGLTQSLNQVSTDLANSDKAAANGG
jgi:hypothetical protein